MDGEDYDFDTVGPVGCSLSDDEVNFGFLVGDNEVGLVGGATRSGSGWQGRIDLTVQGDSGVVNYFTDFTDGDGVVAVDGDSLSYTGEWELLSGGGSDAESVGEGTVALTCA